MKGVLSETGLVSRRLDFLSIDNMYMPDESPWWDGKLPYNDTNGTGCELLKLPTLESLIVDDDFLSKLKGDYSSCTYLCVENIDRMKRWNNI